MPSAVKHASTEELYVLTRAYALNHAMSWQIRVHLQVVVVYYIYLGELITGNYALITRIRKVSYLATCMPCMWRDIL